MSSRSQEELLEDILEASRRILEYTQELDYKLFQKDTKTQDAVVRNIEIIGEATKSLPDIFKEANPEIPWKSIAGMRDKLIHEYFGINTDIVWGVATKNLPELIRFIRNFFQSNRKAPKGAEI